MRRAQREGVGINKKSISNSTSYKFFESNIRTYVKEIRSKRNCVANETASSEQNRNKNKIIQNGMYPIHVRVVEFKFAAATVELVIGGGGGGGRMCFVLIASDVRVC